MARVNPKGVRASSRDPSRRLRQRRRAARSIVMAAAGGTPLGAYAEQAALPQTTTIGQPGDGVLDFAYDSATGDFRIIYDSDPRITAAKPLQVVRLNSLGGLF